MITPERRAILRHALGLTRTARPTYPRGRYLLHRWQGSRGIDNLYCYDGDT